MNLIEELKGGNKMDRENINLVEEKMLNRLLLNTTLEAERYQDMTQEVLDYILQHQDIKEINEIYNIIKKWAC